MFSDVFHQQYFFEIECLPHPVTQVIYLRLKSVLWERDMKSAVALYCNSLIPKGQKSELS